MELARNLLRAVRRQPVSFVPFDISLCPSQVDTFRRKTDSADLGRYFGMCHRSLWLDLEKTYEDPRALYRGATLPEKIWFDAWGVGHSTGSEAAMHMTRMHHPLAAVDRLDDIRRYPIPKVRSDAFARAAEQVQEIHAEGLAAVASMACTVWETAWYLRSMEELMTDMMSEDESATILLDRVTNVACEQASAFAAAGADILHLGDDIGTQRGPLMSVELWRTWLKPRLKRVIDAARAAKPDVLIFYHSCGNVSAFLEELVETGIDILNPVQPECMDFAAVHARVGAHVAFWGTIGTQSTLPFGTPEDVRRAVLDRFEICGKQGGLVLGPTHLVEPEVPWENLVALKAAVDEVNA